MYSQKGWILCEARGLSGIRNKAHNIYSLFSAEKYQSSCTSWKVWYLVIGFFSNSILFKCIDQQSLLFLYWAEMREILHLLTPPWHLSHSPDKCFIVRTHQLSLRRFRDLAEVLGIIRHKILFDDSLLWQHGGAGRHQDRHHQGHLPLRPGERRPRWRSVQDLVRVVISKLQVTQDQYD